MNRLLSLAAWLPWLLQSLIAASAGNVNSGAPPFGPLTKDLAEAFERVDKDPGSVADSTSSRRLQWWDSSIRTPYRAQTADLHIKDGYISGQVYVDACTVQANGAMEPYFYFNFFDTYNWTTLPGVGQAGGGYIGCMGDICHAANVTWDQATYSLAAEAYNMTNVGSNPAPQSLTGERAVFRVMGPLRVNFSKIEGIGDMIQGNTTPPDLDLMFVTAKMARDFDMPDNYIDLPAGPQAIIFWMHALHIPEWSMRLEPITVDVDKPEVEQAEGVGLLAQRPQCSSSIWIPPQMIPSGTTHLRTTVGYYWNDIDIRYREGLLPLHPMPDPPTSVAFMDTNPAENYIEGQLNITGPMHGPKVWQYVLFWGTAGSANRTVRHGWLAQYETNPGWGWQDLHRNERQARIRDTYDWDNNTLTGSGRDLMATFTSLLFVEEADTYRFQIYATSGDWSSIRAIRLLVDRLQVGVVGQHDTLQCSHYLSHGWHEITIEYEEAADYDGVSLVAFYAGADTFFVMTELDYAVQLAEEPHMLWMVDTYWGTYIYRDIPKGATHLHVFSYTQNNDWFFNQGILSTKAYIIPVMDLGAQVPVPDRVAFHDTDTGSGMAAGEVMIYGDMHNVQQFNLYWGDAYGNKLSMDPFLTTPPSSSGKRLCGQKGSDNSMTWDNQYYDFIGAYYPEYYDTTLDIVNGREATECEWPWQVHLVNQLYPAAICGGTLISPRWVVTAAHCVTGGQSDIYWINVHIGKHDNAGPEDIIRAKNIIVHPGWVGAIQYANDIALIELARDAVSSDCVGYACLTDGPPVPGTECYITGWGARSHTNGQAASDLMEAPVTIMHPAECMSRHEGSPVEMGITEGTVCVTGFEEPGVTSACFGDSGGPLVCQSGDTGTWELFGATSWGWQCAGWHFPNVYANIWYYKWWIMEHVDDSVELYQGSGVTKLMLPPMPMPADAYYLMVFSEANGMETNQAAMTRVMDYAPPQVAPIGIMFTDVAAERNVAAGLLIVDCAASEGGIDAYQVYYAKPGGSNIDMLAELPTCAQQQLWSGGSLMTKTSMWLDNTQIPFSTRRNRRSSGAETAIHLRAYAVSHAYGMGMTFAEVAVNDTVNTNAPKAVHFEDKDHAMGMVGGPVNWDVSLSGNYTLEWGSGPSCDSALSGAETWTLSAAMIPSMPSASCEGPTCALIDISNFIDANGSGMIISHENYGNNEEATLRLEGPATLHFTYFLTDPQDIFIVADDLSRPARAFLLGNMTGFELNIPESGYVLRWNSDEFGSGGSWVFTMRPVPHWSEPPAMVAYGTQIPNDGNYMLLKDTFGDCAMTMVHDSAPTMEVAEMASFMDEDALEGRIMGTVHITRMAPVPSEPTSFNVFFGYMGTTGMPMAMQKPIASKMAFLSDSMVQVHVPRTYLPRGHMVTHLLIYAANATGQAMQSYSMPFTDVIAPTFPPIAANFNDSDARPGVAGGNISVTRHPSDSVSTHWSIYWSIGGMQGGFVTRAMQTGMPRCEGTACDVIEMRPGQRPNSWIISRGMDGYEGGEYANITAPGSYGYMKIVTDLPHPGEGSFDVLTVRRDGHRFYGQRDTDLYYEWHDPLFWYSSPDGGRSRGGWSVEVFPEYFGTPWGGQGQPNPVPVPSVNIPPGAEGFIVKAAYGNSDAPVGLTVLFEDFAPPQLVPADVSFHDMDLAPGYVAGPVMITRARNDLVAGAQAYCVKTVHPWSFHSQELDCYMITPSSPAIITVHLPRTRASEARSIYVSVYGTGGEAVEGVERAVVDEIGLWVSPMEINEHLPHGSMSDVTVTVHNDGTEMMKVFPFLAYETDCDDIPSKLELMEIAGVRGDYYEYYYYGSEPNSTNHTSTNHTSTNHTRRLQQEPAEPAPGVKSVLFKLQDILDSDLTPDDLVAALAKKYTFKVRSLKGMGWTVATPDDQEIVKDLCAALKTEPEVKHCEMDQPISSPENDQISARRLVDHMERVMPDDPHFGRSWHINHGGDDDDDHDHGINVRNAWNLGTGSGETVVAVIDSAVDINHPDLFPNIWMNGGEIPGNGIDDDGNGYIDDVHGWDFANGDADPSPDPGMEDEQMYGTHVAGTIGAVGNNSMGVTGINWHAKIMPLKIMPAEHHSIWLSNAFEAMEYALENGAKIVVAAWSTENYAYPFMWEDIMKKFVIKSALLITSAGNGHCYPGMDMCYGDYAGMNWPNEPCSLEDRYPQIICVGATSPHGLKAYFSNYGSSVALGAPGVDIWSTIPGGYGVHTGTSTSAAVVAGAASLIWDTYSHLKFWEIKASLLEGADRVNHLYGFFKEGRKLNVHKAMRIAGSAFWARESVHLLEVPPMSSENFTVTLGSPLLCTGTMRGQILFYTTPLFDYYWSQIKLRPTVVKYSMAPTSKPASVMFADMDTTQGIIGGSLYVTSSFGVDKERDYDHYSLWWANAMGPISKIMDIPAPGTMMEDVPAMDDFNSMYDSWFLPDAGVGYMYHSGLLRFSGPFSVAHRTFAQMVQAPFQIGFQLHRSNGTLAAAMVQIGEEPMAVKAMVGSDNSFMIVLPDGSSHRSGCSHVDWNHYEPPRWSYDVSEREERPLPWVILHVTEDAILMGGDDDDCGLRVPWMFTGLHKLMVGSDCTGQCAERGSIWETMAFRPMTDTAVVMLQGLLIPSGADHLEVRTQNFFGMAEEGMKIPFEDNFTLGDPVPPSDVMASSPTISTLMVTWTANSLNSCVFSSWKVEAKLTTGSWMEVTDCQIMDATVTSCVASGLMSNTLYMFRVRPVCETTGDAEPSDPSASVRTLAVASEPPSGVAATSVVLGTTTVSWQAAMLNDCIFQEYHVSSRASSSTMWSDSVQGCMSLSSFTQPFCTAQGLDDMENYEFRVAVNCKDGSGNSPWSTPSLPTVTLSIEVEPPDEFTQTTFTFNIDFNLIANDDALAEQVIDAIGDVFEALLGFRPESITLQQGAAIPGQLRPLSAVVVLRGKNDVDEATVGSTVSSTITNRTAVQGDVVSTSASSQKASFPPVLDAGSPGQVRMRRLQGANFDVLVEWDLLPVNDCLFSSFLVLADPLHIDAPAFTPEGCQRLTQISTSSCTARNLESSTMQTMYNFTVTVVCSNSIASSNPSAIATVTLPIAPSSTTSTSSSPTASSTTLTSPTSSSSTSTSDTSRSSRSSRSISTSTSTATSTSSATSVTSESSTTSTSTSVTAGPEQVTNTTTTDSQGGTDASSSVRQVCLGGTSWFIAGLLVHLIA